MINDQHKKNASITFLISQSLKKTHSLEKICDKDRKRFYNMYMSQEVKKSNQQSLSRYNRNRYNITNLFLVQDSLNLCSPS